MSAAVYGAVAADYLAAGFAPLPLDPGTKWPPPEGFTGHHGDPTPEQVEEWSRQNPTGNIALRLPADVIGIDVDHYGATKRGLDELRTLEERLGSLPPTVISTSRENGSGIRLYLVPNGTKLAGSLGASIEAIQRHHRYIVASPSIHPDTGQRYRWIEEGSGEVLDRVPRIDELPALPSVWLEEFSRPDLGDTAAGANGEQVAKFIAEHDSGERSDWLAQQRRRLDERDSGRHDALVSVAMRAMREAAAGAYPAAAAIEMLRAWWLEVMDDTARRDGDEFDKAIAWAIGQAIAKPEKVAEIGERLEAVQVVEEWERSAPIADPAAPSVPEMPGRPFGLRTVAEISAEVDAMPPTRWLWRRVWPADAYGVIAAAPKVGKSYMALDAAVSVAAGTKWLGMFEPETLGPVIAFMGEGGARKMTRRGRAVAEHHGVEWDTLPIHLAERVPQLNDAAHVAALAAEVDRVRPALVIVDPLYLAARGVDFAKLNEVGGALEGAQHACQVSGAALMFFHHYNRSGKTGADAMSGAGAAEWGRVLVGLDAKVSNTDTVTERSDVHVEMSIKGDEIAERAYRYRRQVWVDDPDDLGSPMHYSVEPIAADAVTILDGMNKTQRRTLAAVNSRADWMSKREVGDVLANDGQGSPLKERTILDALKYLVEVGRIEVHRDGAGLPGSWRSIANAGEDRSS